MASFSDFRGTGFRRSRPQEDDDPTSGLTNLADCMLVLACGLMVALVVAWNIDITTITEVTPQQDAQEISDIESVTGDLNSGGSSYIDMGRVYQDPESGKLYMVEEGSGSANGAAGSQDAGASSSDGASTGGE